MKVLNFLEIVSTTQESEINHIIKLLQPSFWGTIREFYLQQFRPGIITELFEGCKLDKINVYSCDFNEEQSCVFYHKERYEFCFVDEPAQAFPTPRTLDDFINDCQRAGIELHWRGK